MATKPHWYNTDTMNPKNLNSDNFPFSGPKKINNPLEVMQDGEEVIYEVKRHPAGIFGLYIGAGILLIILALLCFIFAPNSFGDNAAVMVVGTLVFFFVAVLILLFVFISTVVYWGNHWIVTTDSLTQISQVNLFKKQNSQLSLESLEDISVEKNGFFAQVFGYGTLKAETAGEHEKFVFRYCPEPNKYAQKLLEAREKFARGEHPTANKVSVTTRTSTHSTKPTIEQLGQAALADFPDSSDGDHR